MRIGLFRHFPVEQRFPSGWITAAELQQWRARYDLSGAQSGEFDLGGVNWQACISSDLPRARITADTVFDGEVEYTALLREPQFDQFNTSNIKLPFSGWRWMMRLSWLTGHQSQRVCRDEFKNRVFAVADRLTALAQDTLVVSHAGMMAYLGAELRRRGYSGPRLKIADPARAYIYENGVL